MSFYSSPLVLEWRRDSPSDRLPPSSYRLLDGVRRLRGPFCPLRLHRWPQTSFFSKVVGYHSWPFPIQYLLSRKITELCSLGSVTKISYIQSTKKTVRKRHRSRPRDCRPLRGLFPNDDPACLVDSSFVTPSTRHRHGSRPPSSLRPHLFCPEPVVVETTLSHEAFWGLKVTKQLTLYYQRHVKKPLDLNTQWKAMKNLIKVHSWSLY